MKLETGIISLWCNIVAVLSGLFTRTGPGGVASTFPACRNMSPYLYCSSKPQEKQGPHGKKVKTARTLF